MSLKLPSLNNIPYIYFNMPIISEYDVRKAIWTWIMMSAVSTAGGKVVIGRKPRYKFDMDQMRNHDYMRHFFDANNPRRNRLNRASDNKSTELTNQLAE